MIQEEKGVLRLLYLHVLDLLSIARCLLNA
jgi:hypothetical protein